MYPRNFIAPDGRVFGYDSSGRMYYVNPTGTGTIATAAASSPASIAAATRARRCSARAASCSSAATPTARSSSTSPAGTPVVTPTQSMSSQRRLVNATILPNGKVLATGGSQVNNELTGVNNSAEIWDPTTGTWRQGPSGQRARLYHSMSLLLPDARVLVGGGGAPGSAART